MRKRKPDTLMLLAVLIGLGVLATGFVQAMGGGTPPTTISAQR
ncbi:MAG: hypothetical protein AB7U81_09975 [Thiohalomonadaceae bacterium]